MVSAMIGTGQAIKLREGRAPWNTTIFCALLLACASMINPIRAGIVFEGPVYSDVLKTNRFIRIYVPASYESQRARRYPVLYALDGQNLFSSVGTNVAFGWGNWALDTTAPAQAAAGKMEELIIVGIDAPPDRYGEYRGPVYRSDLEQSKRPGPPRALTAERDPFERFSRFLIDELKPRIDRQYRTLTAPADTGVMGSSLGGIASLALAWKHPEVFGKAGSMSGAFQVEQKKFLQVLRNYQGKPKPVRIYLDSGVADFTGGDDGRQDTLAVVQELRRIGWKDGVNLRYFVDDILLDETELAKAGLRQDKWKEAQRSQHNEFYWGRRVHRPLSFLFGVHQERSKGENSPKNVAD